MKPYCRFWVMRRSRPSSRLRGYLNAMISASFVSRNTAICMLFMAGKQRSLDDALGKNIT